MKPITKQPNKGRAFTIVELLTVMSIIVILISLLVPALNMVKRYARDVKQRAQFHSINVAIDLFHGEFDDYPDSDAFDGVISYNYCGAMKLAEAMVGQDLLGLHPSSIFRSDGINPALPAPYDDLYPSLDLTTPDPVHVENLRARKGPYLPPEGANVNTLLDLYGADNFGNLGKPPTDDPNGGIVLCDEYTRVRNNRTGKKVGMPILYYRADTSRTGHTYQTPPNNSQNIYNCDDNIELINLDLPWDTAHQHPMASGGQTPDGVNSDPAIFYDKTEDNKITAIKRPYRPDSYILISAGFDGLYGTDDDVYNFER